MLNVLLKRCKLGSRQEWLFVLFEGLSVEKEQRLLNLRKYCTSRMFSISGSFEGMINLLEIISFINVNNNHVVLNAIRFNQHKFERASYFDQFHFYGCLIDSLKRYGVLHDMFNSENVRFNPEISQYYILDNRFPSQYFPVRNLLLSTRFLCRNEHIANHLMVNEQFTLDFRKSVVIEFSSQGNKSRRVSIAELKQAIRAKEDAGRYAELFALEFERRRLLGHPEPRMIKIISEEFSNAGYDIESYDRIDSVVQDRFIEVKSFVGNVDFYWSRNEVEAAKELGSKYYLYLIDRSKIEETGYKPQQLQDPYKKIFENDAWLKEAESWKVQLMG